MTETWIKNGRRLENNKQRLVDSEDIGIIERNRPGRRGGGVAILYNTKHMSLKRWKTTGGKYEVVAAVGRTVRDSRPVLVIAAYLPPKMTARDVTEVNDSISDTIDRAKTAHRGLSIICCGDFNKKPLDVLLADHPDITVLQTPSTRGGENLDLCLTNIEHSSIQVARRQPLQDESGNVSDHKVIHCSARTRRLHVFEKRRIRFRPYTEEGEAKFGQMLAAVDWAFLYGLGVNEAAKEMHDMLEWMEDECFPVKVRTIKSSDPPWMTNGVRKMIRRRKKVYKRRGKGRNWERRKLGTETAIREAKVKYADRVRKNVKESGNMGEYFKAVKLMKCKEAPKKWNVRDLYPDKNPQEVADLCADYFSSISREYQPIEAPEPNDDPPVLLLHEVSARLRHCKKPKSRVRGDISPNLITKYADLLAVPLLCIYNLVFRDCVWPDI